MADKPLPKGGEPPRGFEKVYEESENDGSLRVEFVSATQLASIEKKELESLRKDALQVIHGFTGDDRITGLTFEREATLWPEGKSPSDKLVFKAYEQGETRGYALVVRGWPHTKDWTIQHLIINPEARMQGVGSAIVSAIETRAQASSIERVVAIPIAHENDAFWKFLGYTRNEEKLYIDWQDKHIELRSYKKPVG